MGPEGSATWTLLLEAAEGILRDEGYGALTSRRVAARAGVKQQLVYYYFRTMDDLIVEALRRMCQRELARLAAAAASPRPLHELWGACVETSDQRLIVELMALANRSEGVRAEVIGFIEESRRLQAEAVSRAVRARDGASPLSPMVITVLATSVALALNREASLGVVMGHGEVERLIAEVLGALEA
jgi:AcrR family transcriptional regulator